MKKNVTVLIVDDSRVAQRIMTDHLKEYGVEHFVYAENGEDAKELLPKANLVIVDKTMAKMDGVAFARWVRSHEEHYQLPVLMVTSTADEIESREARENGVDIVLLKPVNKEILFSLLKKYLYSNSVRTSLNHLNPFAQAAEKIFVQFTGTSPEFTPNIYNISDSPRICEITSIISFSGNAQGSMLLSMDREVACNLVSRLLSISTDDVDEAILIDGVGEMANMISGNAKHALNGMGISINISIPNVIVGANYNISRPHCQASVYTTIKSEFGELILDVSMIRKKREWIYSLKEEKR